MSAAFQSFGPAHLVAIFITATLPFGLAALARRARSPALDRAVRIALALILALNFLGYGVRACLSRSVTWEAALPCQLCDWTMIAVIVALLNGGRPRWLEVIYFWGIAGSLQAVLTPNLQFNFPDYRFLAFFIDHCGIVISVIYLMMSRRFRPRLAAVGRTLFWSEVYLGVALVADAISGVNYGFLLHKPEAFSILNYLSDHRVPYLLQLNALALFFFALLYLPFALFDCFRRRPRRDDACLSA